MTTAKVRPARWVIKIGSALITADDTGLNLDNIRHWCFQFAQLMEGGLELVLVSSGSIAEGMHRLKWSDRPTDIHELQAAAAVGQMGLVRPHWYQRRARAIKDYSRWQGRAEVR